MFNEIGKPGQRLLPVHRKVKALEAAEVPGKALLHQSQHSLRGRIRRKRQRRRRRLPGWHFAAVVGVEVPLLADRLIAVHEQAGAPAHITVEELHAQLLAALGPALEISTGTEETIILEDLHGQAQICLPRSQIGEHAVLARPGGDNLLGTKFSRRSLNLGKETAAVFRCVQGDVANRNPAGFELGREMAHGGENQRNLARVVGNVGGLLHHLHHDHSITAVWIKLAQAGQIMAELIAEDGKESHGSRSPQPTRRYSKLEPRTLNCRPAQLLLRS